MVFDLSRESHNNLARYSKYQRADSYFEWHQICSTFHMHFVSCFPTHRTSAEAAESYLFDRMSGHGVADFESHIRKCGNCAEEVEVTRAFVDAMRELCDSAHYYAGPSCAVGRRGLQLLRTYDPVSHRSGKRCGIGRTATNRLPEVAR